MLQLRFWERLVLAIALTATSPGVNAIEITEQQLLNTSYDYVIVGGGTSGLTIANRLTENGKRNVLVIEYGYLDDDPNILLPYGVNYPTTSRRYNLTALPIPGLNNRTYNVSVGAVVGGGSAVNGMFFDRGAKSDYDAWQALGNPGWSWDDLLPWFKKSATFTPPTDEEVQKYNYTYDESAYGRKGPVQISLPSYSYPGTEYSWYAWKELGVPRPREGANGDAIGVFFSPSAIDPVKKSRSYARTAHYDPYRNRTNYHLITGYQATEILFEDDLTAVGVNIVKRGDAPQKKIAVKAQRETIVAAGAIWTPWLLQRSGFGPKELLESAGISIKKDMPGVGANFQDHPVGVGSWNWTKSTLWPMPNTGLTNETFAAESMKEYKEHKIGPFTATRGNNAAFLPLKMAAPDAWKSIVDAVAKQDSSQYLPKTYDANLIQGFIHQQKVTSDLLSRDDSAAYEFVFGPGPIGGGVLMRPLSRGTVNINPADPLGAPLIDYRTYSNPLDIQQAIQTVHFVRRFNTAKALSTLDPVELTPGSNITSDAAITAYLRTTSNPTFAHASGTASMMPEEYGGIVDTKLRVWQTKRLSVVDASIIPLIPATHLCTTVYAVAERAAQLIKNRTDWDRP